MAAGEVVRVKVPSGMVAIRRRERADAGRVQLNVRVPVELARRLRLFAAANDLLVKDCLEAGVRAVLGERAG